MTATGPRRLRRQPTGCCPTTCPRWRTCAAGTGGFSRVLSARGIEVVAVELDPRMATVLRDRSPHVHAAVGRGEELPIRTCSLDAVLVSSAWHWLDPSRAVPEMARVLRPGGVLGVLWNGPNRRVDWVNEILGENHAGVAPSGGPRRRLEIPEGQPFGIPAARVIEWTLPRTRRATDWAGGNVQPGHHLDAWRTRQHHAPRRRPYRPASAATEPPLHRLTDERTGLEGRPAERPRLLMATTPGRAAVQSTASSSTGVAITSTRASPRRAVKASGFPMAPASMRRCRACAPLMG